MPLIPHRLPIWAYAVAGGAAFVAARIASSSPDQGAPAAPGGAGSAGDPASSDLWQSFGGGTADGYGQFGGGDGGVLPPADPGQTGAGTTTPPPTAPAPSPAPAPTVSPDPGRPAGARPRGAAGWLVFYRGSTTRYTVNAQGLITGSSPVLTSTAFSAWCSTPSSHQVAGASITTTRYITKILSGARSGWWIHVGEHTKFVAG